jgi:flagellar hook-length control protein FliK
MSEAPAPAAKPQAATLLSAPEAPRKEQPAAASLDSMAPRNPDPASTLVRDTAVALPRSESLGLQPAQGGATAVVAQSRDTQTAIIKAPVQMQWQAPVPSLVNQVEGGIRWMLRSSAQGAELQLHPENLGRVRIELKVVGAEVHARLWASDPKSLPVLQDNKAFLEVSLKEQGLNLGSFDLRQNPQQAQTRNQGGESSGQHWATEAPKPNFRQETPIPAWPIGAQARRLEIFA